MITIDGLTKRQVRYLDKMWSLDTLEEYTAWKDTLCYAQKQEVELLEQMVVLAELDAVEMTEDADEILRRYRLT